MEPLTLFGIGVSVVCIGIARLDRALSMRRWQAVQGEILRSEVIEEQRANDGQTFYQPALMYGYIVGETELAGHRRGPISATVRFYAESVVKQYPPGRIVTVYFDPANPKDSVLERRTASVWPGVLIGLGASAALAGAVWWWLTEFTP